MPVRVRVVGKGHPVLILQADQPGHRVGTGAVHADYTIVIDRHEREGRVHLWVDHGDVQLVDRVDRLPVLPGGAAERIHAELQAGAPDGVHVDDVFQVVDIGQDEVFLVGARRLDGRCEDGTRVTPALPPVQQLVGPILDPSRHVGVGRAPVGRVVLEAAVLRRVVRGRDNDTVGEVVPAAAVVDEDGPRDDGRWRDAIVALDDRLNPVSRQHLDGGALGWPGQGVRVLSHVERAVDPLGAAVVADGLGDGQDMGLGERAAKRGAPVPAGAEADQLVRVAQVGLAVVVLPFQPAHVHQHLLRSRLACQWRDSHGLFSPLLGEYLSSSRCFLALRHRTRLHVPDVRRVLGDGAIAGELSGAGHVQDRLARPSLRILVQL